MIVICTDDSGKPESIPTSKWLKKGEKYTIIAVCKMNRQGGLAGVKLAEVSIDAYFPYTHYSINRFRPLDESESILHNIQEAIEKENLELIEL